MTTRNLCLLVGRVALASGFLSSVADRFGLWGAPGSRYAAWGDWSHFLTNVASLNAFLPISFIPFVAWCSTFAETLAGVLLLVGYRLKWTAYGCASLLSIFALAMSIANGIKAPLDSSVFSAAALALLIGATVSHERILDAA